MLSIMKSRHDNDVTDHIGVISIENDIKLSRPIKQYVVNDKDET